jgi:uncharacterized protein (DUF1800 family)
VVAKIVDESYDHDDGVKTFLGETGRFNGEDIIAIIAHQEPTARFLCTRLFQFFAADQVDEEGQQVIVTALKYGVPRRRSMASCTAPES